MPIRHAIWRFGTKPQLLEEVTLGKEALLEQMIVDDLTILSDRWMLIGRQVHTDYGGFIDLLALNPDGQLIVIELKRDQTPREVVAQALAHEVGAHRHREAVAQLDPLALSPGRQMQHARRPQPVEVVKQRREGQVFQAAGELGSRLRSGLAGERS